MKKLLGALGVLVMAGTIWTTLPCENRVFAQSASGCCKERDSFRDRWQRNGKTFKQCAKANRRRDGDNISDRRGFVWWDKRC